jgi:hypothetical protein
MLSSGEWIRNKRLLGSRPHPGYFPNEGIPVGSPSNNTTAKAMVLACIDPRYTYAVEEFLVKQLDSQHYYDLFALAGASLGAGATGTAVSGLYDPALYQEIFFEHLQIAVALHGITEIYAFDHLDCGAYKNFYSPPLTGPNGPDCNKQTHVNVINWMKTELSTSGIPSISGLNVTGYIVDSPDCPAGTGCFSKVVGNVAQPLVPPYCAQIPPNTGASVLILGCIDPRYSALLSQFLIQYKDIQFNYDLFTLAGASLGFNQSYLTYDTLLRTAGVAGSQYPLNLIPQWGVLWGPVFCDHIRIALAIHNITEIWAFDHLDCGAYKRIKFGNPSIPDLDINQHTPELRKMMMNIRSTPAFSKLAFKGFVMDTEGTITQVVSSGNGIVIPNTKVPGSSRIRNYSSLNTARVGFFKGDYKTKSDSTACQHGSSSPQITAIKLCTCSPELVGGSGICPSCHPHLP